jgi:TatD DNase family protein
MWIDIHCHLDKLEIQPEEAIKLAKESGVDQVITIGTEPADHQIVLEYARTYGPFVSATLGVHPHEAKLWDQRIGDFFRRLGPSSEVVALGEMGLDYYYSHSEPLVQIAAFHEQLEIAGELGLPVQVHTRDADADTVEVLKKHKGQVRGVIHCFSGDRDFARKCLDCDFNISFSGIVTFKNAQELREVLKFVPRDRFHVETDSPFLAPVPHRGKKNMPAWVSVVGQFVARELEMTAEQLAFLTRTNTLDLFPKLRRSEDGKSQSCH